MNIALLQIKCYDFLVSFFKLGHSEKDKSRLEQLKANREGLLLYKEEQAKKLHMQANKTNILVDFEFTDEDKDSALSKMAESSTKVCSCICVILIEYSYRCVYA